MLRLMKVWCQRYGFGMTDRGGVLMGPSPQGVGSSSRFGMRGGSARNRASVSVFAMG